MDVVLLGLPHKVTAQKVPEILDVEPADRDAVVPQPADAGADRTSVGGVIFVNDQIEVDGDGFLLGGDEGTTYARVAGCFQPDAGGTCTPIAQQPTSRWRRSIRVARRRRRSRSRRSSSASSPARSPARSRSSTSRRAAPRRGAQPIDVSYTLVTSQIFSVDPPAASLGQYVFVHGGGFVGGETGALTQVELDRHVHEDRRAAGEHRR